MAMRIRKIGGKTVALCAAQSQPKGDDIYLDDVVDHAIREKLMKDFIREIIGFIFRFSGIPFLIREILCKNKVVIIIYHNPKHDNVFDEHGFCAKSQELVLRDSPGFVVYSN